VVLNVVHNVVHTTGGHVPAFAKGTMSAPGGLAWVGEQGPELVNLPRGSQVIPAGRSARMAAGGGGGVTVVVHASGLVDPSSMARAIEAELAKLRRTRGGSELAFQ
jgi:phage-related tail protein